MFVEHLIDSVHLWTNFPSQSLPSTIQRQQSRNWIDYQEQQSWNWITDNTNLYFIQYQPNDVWGDPWWQIGVNLIQYILPSH